MSSLLRPSIHWLFVFIPVSVVLDRIEVPAPVLFFSAALAILPVASLVGASMLAASMSEILVGAAEGAMMFYVMPD